MNSRASTLAVGLSSGVFGSTRVSAGENEADRLRPAPCGSWSCDSGEGSLFRFVMDPALASGVGQPFRAGDFYVVVLCHVKDTLSFQEGLGASEETDLGLEAYSRHVSGSADVGSAPPQPTAGACVRHDRADVVYIGTGLR